MTREPLIKTLRRHGADPQFDVASFRCGVITDKAGQRLKWHYGGSDCSYVSSQKAYGSHRLRIIDNLARKGCEAVILVEPSWIWCTS